MPEVRIIGRMVQDDRKAKVALNLNPDLNPVEYLWDVVEQDIKFTVRTLRGW